MLECAKSTDAVYKANKGNDGISTVDCVNANYSGHKEFLCDSNKLGNFYFGRWLAKLIFTGNMIG